MTTKAPPAPFHALACQRLRKLARIRNDADIKKGRATKSRDELQKEIDTCNKQETKKLEHLKALCFDEMSEIKRCNAIIVATDGHIIETIEGGDQENFLMDDNPTVASLFDKPDDEEEVVGGGESTDPDPGDDEDDSDE